MASFDIIARLKLAGEKFTSDFGSTMDTAEKQARASSSRIGAAFASIGGLAGGIGIGAIAAAGKAALDYADDLGTAADQMGTTVERAQTLREGFRSLEVDGDKFEQGMKRLVVTLGDVQSGAENGATKALDKMGISQRILSGEISTTDQLLDAIAASSTRYASTAAYASDTVDIFGRKIGVDMVAALKDGGAALHEAEKAFTQTGSVISSDLIGTLADANERIDAFATRAKNRLVIWAGETIELIDKVMYRSNQFDAFLSRITGGDPSQFQAGVDDYEKRRGQRPEYVADLRKDALAKRATLNQTKAALASGDMLPRMAQGAIRAQSEEYRKAADAYNSALAAYNAGKPAVALPPPSFNPPPRSTGGGAGGRARSGGDRPSAPRISDQAREQQARDKEKADRAQAFAASVRQSEANLRFLDLRKRGLDDEAELAERLFRVNEQYGKDTADQLATRRALVTLEFNTEQSLKNQTKEVAERSEIERAALEESRRMQEQDAERQRDRIDTLAGYFETAMADGADGMWRDFQQEGERAISNLAAQWVLSKIGDPNASGASANPLGALMQMVGGKLGLSGRDRGGDDFLADTLGGRADDRAGAAAAATVGIKLASDAFGLKQSKLGGQVGSVAGNFIPGLPPGVGSALGEAVGSVVGGLFKATKAGFASFGTVNGSLGVSSVGGNSSKLSAAASDAADTVTQTLQRIAETLGGNLSGSASGSLGIRHGDYRYDPTGRGVTKKDKGAIDFDGDAAAAVAYAVSDLLKDGVLQGVSDAQKRLLQSGGDLESAIEKASLIGEIPRLLKARLDPVGSAIDDVTKRFGNLRKVMEEAGSSATERAEAEQLYQLELDEAKRSAGGAADSLRDFLKGMQVGSSSAMSLRDQEAAAQAALQPFLDKIAGGGSVDNDRYLAAAQDYLDVERQLNGSTQSYFDALSKVQAATNSAIANIDKVSSITPGVDPLAARTADATSATASNTLAAAEIASQQTTMLARLEQVLGRIERNTAGGIGSFIGTDRSFLQA